MRISIAEKCEIRKEKSKNIRINFLLAKAYVISYTVLNGYEATKAIRASFHKEAKTIPIYAMSANSFTEDINESFQSGMNGHLKKPIEIEEVYSILQKVISEKSK